MDTEDLRAAAMSRRSALKKGAGAVFLLTQAAISEQLVMVPVRPATPPRRHRAFPVIELT